MTNDDELQWALKEAENLLGVGDRITMAIFNADARIRELEAELDSLGDLSEWEKVCAGTHVVVPVDPTEAMQLAIYNASGLTRGDEQMRMYRAMLKAAQEGDNG